MYQDNVANRDQIEVPEECIYTSSDGTKKDVRYLNTEYLINALAKCHREVYNQTTDENIRKYLTNITNIESELNHRILKFISKENKDDSKDS